eukprot:6209828-Pleurochrysis_carterae.AAC.2
MATACCMAGRSSRAALAVIGDRGMTFTNLIRDYFPVRSSAYYPVPKRKGQLGPRGQPHCTLRCESGNQPANRLLGCSKKGRSCPLELMRHCQRDEWEMPPSFGIDVSLSLDEVRTWTDPLVYWHANFGDLATDNPSYYPMAPGWPESSLHAKEVPREKFTGSYSAKRVMVYLPQ